jgi:NAD(P)-dependent dehydrogenase (short-subunit alcohol dehydrogenase family)
VKGKNMRLTDKVILLSGGARGMGREMVKLFTEHGAYVISGDVQKPDGITPERAEDVVLDVSNEDNWREVVEKTLAKHGRIDVLVNNAGILVTEDVLTLSRAGWEKSIAVNQTGVWLGMRAVIPTMQKQKAGSIINFSSTWGKVGAPGSHAYHATKGAVVTMTKNAAMSYVSDGIRVNSVHPGLIDTQMSAGIPEGDRDKVAQSTPMKRWGRPIEVAYGVLFLASDEASFVTGSELVIDGGYLAQ